MSTPQARYAAVDAVLADPPDVHANAPGGVWSTSRDCYRLIAERCGPGTHTIETGCGVSTVLLAMLGCTHTCVTPGDFERSAIEAHLDSRGIDRSALRWEVTLSHLALPRLLAEGMIVDLALVDGGHGFPTPIVDWLYAGSMLRPGGLLILDDNHLPAVRMLLRVLDRDPKWAKVAGSAKWSAWERRTAAQLVEDWTGQPYLLSRRYRANELRRRVTGRARHELQRVRKNP